MARHGKSPLLSRPPRDRHDCIWLWSVERANVSMGTTSTCIATEYLHTRTGSPSVSTFSCVECLDGAECASRFSTLSGLGPDIGVQHSMRLCTILVWKGSATAQEELSSRNATHADVQCRQGHTGPLCAVCLANHARDVTMQCTPCPPVESGSLRGTSTLAMTFGIIAALTCGASFTLLQYTETKEERRRRNNLKKLLHPPQWSLLLLSQQGG